MKLKKGDILICKKDFPDNGFNTIWYKKNHKYRLNEIKIGYGHQKQDMYFVSIYKNRDFEFNYSELYETFYSENELRKLKLKNLRKI
jgi:hypothetical protein